MKAGSDPDHYGPNRGHPLDPRNPDPPDAVCEGCGAEWAAGDEGSFHEDWLAEQEGPDLAQPATCPECDPGLYEPDQWGDLQDEMGCGGARAYLFGLMGVE